MLISKNIFSVLSTLIFCISYLCTPVIADEGDENAEPQPPENISARSRDGVPPGGFNPCADVSIYDFVSSDYDHDGLMRWRWNKIKGKHSNIKFDESSGAFYIKYHWGSDRYRTSFVCTPNPDVSSIINNPEKMVMYTDVGRSRNVYSSDVTDHIEMMNSHISKNGTGSEHFNEHSCFHCAHFRGEGCFAPDTLISLNEKEAKAAKDIAVGDLLWNPLTKSHSKVLRVIEGPEKLPLVEIGLDNHLLKISTQHPILTEDGYKQAIELSLGDFIYDHRGKKRRIDTLRSLPVAEGQIVINFELEPEGSIDSTDDNHFTVISNGILTAGDITIQKSLAKSKEI